MADGRKNNGGHSTKGYAGRKTKADELKLVERLTPLADLAYAALEQGLEQANPLFVKMWFEYMHGKPSQKIDADVELNVKQLPSWLDGK